jgi:signal transduction histidine kinase
MNPSQRASAALKVLAVHLTQRRPSILSAWRRAVDRDPELTTASTITRAQFIDHIPAVLDAFAHRLSADDSNDRAQAREEQKESASEHGLHRWQQGYNQPETMCEWGHLHLCLLQELEHYETMHVGLESNVMPAARRELVRLCSDGVCSSATRYAHLQQSEAASRMRELESALQQLKLLELERAEAWREAAHDLRGSAHVIANASAVLNRDGLPDQKRTQFSEVLRIGVASLNKLLTDLMDHARLEAGHERRQLTTFDVASLLKEFCDTSRVLAAERNLFLKAEGATSLMIEGDAAKIHRIVQNLVLNALNATQHGGVRVSWEGGDSERRPQWALCVQDTGPGFRDGSATPLERVLRHATAEAHEVEQRNLAPHQDSLCAEAPPTLTSQSAHLPTRPPSGEGIGLSIVKRLCELLDASLELETSKGEGTTFRVVFPRRYQEALVLSASRRQAKQSVKI